MFTSPEKVNTEVVQEENMDVKLFYFGHFQIKFSLHY
jgi:hypothetical protein